MEDEKTAETRDAEKSQIDSYADVDNEEQKKEEVNDATFSDTPNEENAEEHPVRQVQSREQNSENARRRRESERQRELQAAREAAIIDALDGKNPYTGEEMKDSADVEEYLTMKAIEKQGGDPLTDFSKFQKRKEREKSEAAKKEEQSKEWYREDRANFSAKYPDVDLNTLIKDEQFQAFAEGKVGVQPLSDIYAGYLKMTSAYEKKARQMARQMVANKKASPGALKTSGTPGGFYTRDQVKNMSREEVHNNYDKIRESMKYWK